jgi:hypothetical protein
MTSEHQTTIGKIHLHKLQINQQVRHVIIFRHDCIDNNDEPKYYYLLHNAVLK